MSLFSFILLVLFVGTGTLVERNSAHLSIPGVAA